MGTPEDVATEKYFTPPDIKEDKMEYTKGEWRTELDPWNAPEYWRVFSEDSEGVFEDIANNLTKANARLIASAPDLYEALKKLIEETDLPDTEECEHDVGICWCDYKNARLQAAKALAKAK